MQILFAISVLCFAGVLWAALAFARHVKGNQLRGRVAAPSQTDFKERFLSIIETTPPMQIVPERSSETTPSTRQAVLHQSVHDITANKQWALPPQAVHMDRLPVHTVGAGEGVSAMRKPPQSARHGRMELLDPAYFNKDLGDLTDPQPSNLRVNDRSRSNSSKRH
jgi:hypothetical protein